MGDNFKKVQTGQPLKIPAETFNAFLDAARDFRARQQSRETQFQPTFRQSGIVKVKNGSGEDRNRFEILGIDRPIFTPTDNLDTFQNDVLLVGVKPDGEDHPGRFCVLLEPLKSDAIGLAVIAGVCPVRIDVQEESDTFAEVQDDDATQLKSGGSGSVTILWKESGTGENKWAVVRLGDSQPVIRKAEMIDTLRQGDTDPAKAWLLKYEDDEWQRTDQQIDLYGDQGFRGVAFGKTEEVDSGDKIDVYYSHEAKQWYGVVGGWYFHGDVVADIAEGEAGEVKLNVGAGSDAREITVPAFSPYAAVKKDDFVSVNWNTFSVHWDIGKFQGAEPGCGLERDEDPESPDYGKLKVKASDLAGCGLEVDGDCGLKVKNTDLVGPGLVPDGDCALAVELVAGCGIDVTDGTEVSVKATDLAQSGLKTEGECGLAVNPGCGIWINDGKVEVAHDELAGDGLVIGDNCAIDVDCNWIKTECVKPGCGLWWNGDQLEVAHDELAGNGLVIGDNCAIDVDCDWIKTNCINCQAIKDCITPGCGIWWNGDQLEVAHDELAGHGLTVGINCQLDVDCDWIKTECVKPGCGLWWNGDQLEVAHDELAGNGLAIGNGCALDVDWSQIPVGCGVWWNGSALAVAHDELAGRGLVIGNDCALNVSLGCGLRFGTGDSIEVNPASIAGNGLTPGSGCALDVEWSQVPVGCGLWWNGAELAVAHDELAGNGLTIGSNCQLEIDTAPASGYTFSAVTNVDLSLSGCTLTLTRTVTAFELKTNSVGVVIGFAQISSQTLESTASLCDCECLSDSIPGQPMALLTIPGGEWNDMLANGGEVAWPIA